MQFLVVKVHFSKMVKIDLKKCLLGIVRVEQIAKNCFKSSLLL